MARCHYYPHRMSFLLRLIIPTRLLHGKGAGDFLKSALNRPLSDTVGGGPGVVVSTAAFHARVRGSVPGPGGLKETKMFLPHPRVKVSIPGSLRDREVACSASDRQGSNFESCVWRTVSSQSSHHPQEVLLAQFSLYVHNGGLKPDSFHFIFIRHGFTQCDVSLSIFFLTRLIRSISSESPIFHPGTR